MNQHLESTALKCFSCLHSLILAKGNHLLYIIKSMYNRRHDSCICKENAITQKGYFTGQNILILKHSHFALCNSDSYCSLAVSLAGINMAVFTIAQIKKKTDYIITVNSNFPLLSCDVLSANARCVLPPDMFIWISMRTYTCPRLYVKDMEIELLSTLEKNVRIAPPPPHWQIPGYTPEVRIYWGCNAYWG